MSGRAKNSFWLDGGYDDLVQACPHHPAHSWWTFRMGDVVRYCYDPDEHMTICRGCYVARCGSTADEDRCTLWRHHSTAHVLESGRREPMGFALTGGRVTVSSGTLRALAAAATPGPWGEKPAVEVRARLIALAPDLALLLADTMDALAGIDADYNDCGDEDCEDCAYPRRTRALRARFRELEERAGRQT